jgi:hypothetical protein
MEHDEVQAMLHSIMSDDLKKNYALFLFQKYTLL